MMVQKRRKLEGLAEQGGDPQEGSGLDFVVRDVLTPLEIPIPQVPKDTFPTLHRVRF